MLSYMLTVVLKAVKMLLSCCHKNSQDAAVLTALKAVQDAEKNYPHKDQVQRLIPINLGTDICSYSLSLSPLIPPSVTFNPHLSCSRLDRLDYLVLIFGIHRVLRSKATLIIPPRQISQRLHPDEAQPQTSAQNQPPIHPDPLHHC
jgi:hypothetical protein